jgi:hypothetical protein
MASSTILTMVVIIGLVWGGFGFLLATALRKESRKSPDGGERAG